MSQPNVPWWFATGVVVMGSIDSAALTYTDPGFVIPPVVKFALFLVNVACLTLAAVLNIKKPAA